MRLCLSPRLGLKFNPLSYSMESICFSSSSVINGVSFPLLPSLTPPSIFIWGVHLSPAHTCYIQHNCKPCSLLRWRGLYPAKESTLKGTRDPDDSGMARASWDSNAVCSIFEASAEERQMVSGKKFGNQAWTLSSCSFLPSSLIPSSLIPPQVHRALMLLSVLVGVGAFVLIFVAHADSTPPGLMALTEVHGCLATIHKAGQNFRP